MELFLVKLLIKVAIKCAFSGSSIESVVPREESGDDIIEGGIDLFF